MVNKPSVRQQIKSFAVLFTVIWIIIIAAISSLIPNNHPYYGTILTIVIVVGVGLVFLIMSRLDKKIEQKKQLLMQKGVKAKATVVSIGQEIKHGDYHLIVTLKAEVKPEGKSPFTTEVETMVPLVKIPRAGDEIEVVYDPQNPKDIAVL